jgi:enoyl-CoA hydratase/carnithine racemase
MYSAEEARNLGLVHEVLPEDDLMVRAKSIALNLGSKHSRAFTSIKYLLRKPIAENMIQREKESIREFVDIWYSEATWAKLQEIKC